MDYSHICTLLVPRMVQLFMESTKQVSKDIHWICTQTREGRKSPEAEPEREVLGRCTWEGPWRGGAS